MSNPLTQEELKQEIYPLYFTGDSLLEVWLPEERMRHEQSKLRTNHIIQLIEAYKNNACLELLDEIESSIYAEDSGGLLPGALSVIADKRKQFQEGKEKL